MLYTTLRTGFIASLLPIASTCMAQVFIPDASFRDWLEQRVPGVIDDNGIMDTSHPAIATLDSATFVVPAGVTQLDLEGLQWLVALNTFLLRTTGTVSIQCPALPASLTDLNLRMENGDLILPPLHDGLARLSFWGNPSLIGGSCRLTIQGATMTVDEFELSGRMALDLPASTVVDTLLLSPNYVSGSFLPLPPIISLYTRVSGMGLFDTDLGTITTDVLDIDIMIFSPEIVWPLSVRRIQFAESVAQINQVPAWPTMLEELYIPYDVMVECIPTLPDGLTYLRLSYEVQCMPNWPSALITCECPWPGPASAPYCSALDEACAGNHSAITGTVFLDLNADGIQTPGEPAAPHSSVLIEPGGRRIGVSPDGAWLAGVQPGSYTITASSMYPYTQTISPSFHVAQINDLGLIDQDNRFAVTVTPNIQDLMTSVYADPARPGFGNNLHLRCENYGTTTVDAEVTLSFAPDQTWVSSSVPPVSQTGNTATWNFPAMAIGAVQNIVVELHTDASVPLGTTITHALTAEPTATDETPLDNTYTFTDSVVGSYDPNDKLISPAVLTPDEVAAGDKPIVYTIRFQNTGTYHAERVVILDTLSEDLQWSSMRFIASSHAHEWYIRDGVLHVIHDGIMLPDSTADEPGSHGFFTFSMLPAADLDNGSTIGNIAHIVFDFNEPIITPPAVFTVDVSSGVQQADRTGDLRILPNPAHDRIKLRMDGTAPMVYRIMDVLGQQVAQGTIAPDNWLDVQALPAGAYIMDVQRAGVRSSARFVKQ